MTSVRARVIDATLQLLAEHRFEDVTLRAIAQRSGISLGELATTFSSRGAILAAYTKEVDERVLSASFDDMADQEPRDRLFDVLMSRIEMLREHRVAMASLIEAARRDSQLALFLNGLTVRAMRWMMEAAAISPRGTKGALATQRLAIGFARVMRVAAKEEDPGMPRTMAALDRELREMEENHKRLARYFGSAVRAAPAAREAPAAAPFAPEPSEPSYAAAPSDDPVSDPVAPSTAPSETLQDGPDPTRGESTAGPGTEDRPATGADDSNDNTPPGSVS